MTALSIDYCDLGWISTCVLGAAWLMLILYNHRKAEIKEVSGAQGEEPRGAGVRPVPYESKGDERVKLKAVTRPFKNLFNFAVGGNGAPAVGREGLLRMLEVLTGRAMDTVKDKHGISSHYESFHLTALTLSLDNFKEIIGTSSDEQLSDLQQPLGVFAEAAAERVRAQYGLQQYTPEAIRDLIAFGDWCAKAGHSLEHAKKYITIGKPVYESYRKAPAADGTERPNSIEAIGRLYADLPARLGQSDARVSELEGELLKAQTALQEEKDSWSAYAEEKSGLLKQISDLQTTVATNETTISDRDTRIATLDAEIGTLQEEKQQLTTQLADSRSVLSRLGRVGQLAERLTKGRQALDFRLDKNEYRVQLAFLMYYSLFNLSAGIVNEDKQKEKLMLVNLYRLTTRCRQYEDLNIEPFEEASAEIDAELEAEHQAADAEELKNELVSQAKFKGHPDHNLFSLALRDLREGCDISLAPFFIDAESGELMATH